MFPLPHFTNQMRAGADLRTLWIWVSDPASASDLAAFLAGTAYGAVQVREDTLAVSPPLALDEQIARAELGIYVRMWRRRRPGVGAELCP
jgi:hypothetical protein